jgi:hypothetical protein
MTVARRRAIDYSEIIRELFDPGTAGLETIKPS